jgi:PAS domain S-box-containing protein
VSNDDPARITLDHLMQGFQVLSRDWKYLYVNPAVAAQAQTTVEALLGKTMWECFAGIEKTPLFQTLKQVMESRQPASLENEFTYPRGGARWFELRIEPVPDGICVHSIDITERKAAEAKLMALNQELEQRIAQRTRALETANKDLEAYTYTVSHDLRAPLRSIDGFAQALKEDATNLTPECTDHLQRIQANVTRMSKLIDELLKLSRLGQASLSRAEVDLSALAHEVARSLDASEPGRAVRWEITSGLRAQCDPELARVVLENLLGNAHKFTARTALARIAVATSPQDPWAIVVEDNGAGFDMGQVHWLFRPFKRLHHERDFPGTGIGLATVHRIVVKHGGHIEAEGKPGQGARFTLSFG